MNELSMSTPALEKGELGELLIEWLNTLDNSAKDYHWDGCYGTVRGLVCSRIEDFICWLEENK